MAVMPPPVLLIPWSWRLVQRIQGLVDTRPKQYLATVVIPLSFLVAVFVIYLGGKPLKRRFTDELVEIARTLTIMVVALVDAVLFVIVWRRFGETMNELDDFGSRLVPGTGTAVNLYIAFIALLGTYMLTRVTKRLIRYWSETERISPHQRELAHHLTQTTMFLVVSLFIFGLFGLAPADLFLGAGVLGVVLGLAARKTLANVLSGLIILFGRPFEAGDWIAVGEQEGIVTDISVFNTQVRTFNEEHLLIPNDRITDQEVINYSKTDRLRLNTEVGIDYDDDVSTAATVAKRTMESCEAVADSPKPDVILEDFGESEVVLRLRYWIDQPTIQRKLSAQNEVIEAVKDAFETEDVKIPFPQRELTGRAETDGLRVAPSDGVAAADDERLERAVRAVRDVDADESTAVREPVEAELGDDGVPDDAADGSEEKSEDAAGADDGTTDGEPVEEPVEEKYGGDGDPDTDADEGAGTDAEATDEEDLESAAQLVEDEAADLSSPHPRDVDSRVHPGTTDDSLREPVEDEYGQRGEEGQEGSDGGDASDRDDQSSGSEGEAGSDDDDDAASDDDDDAASSGGSSG